MVGGEGNIEFQDNDIGDSSFAVGYFCGGDGGAVKYLAGGVQEAYFRAEALLEMLGEENVLWGDEGELPTISALCGEADSGIKAGSVVGLGI